MTSTEEKKPTVFIIEDDPFVLRIYQRKLGNSGINVQLATNGVEGFERMKEAPPNLILMDLVMPQKDGFELIEDIKRTPSLQHIPIIVLSNLSQEKDIDRVKGMGVEEYFVKAHTSIHAVVDRVNQLLGISESHT